MVDIVYDIPEKKVELHRHVLAVIVDNEFGILGRVVGLFSSRGYNIESLTVAEVDHERKLSRITVVTSGTERVVHQIKTLLERMVPVHIVHDLTVEGPHVERELALIKVSGEGEKRVEALRIAALSLLSPLLLGAVHQHGLRGDGVRPLALPALCDEILDRFLLAYGRRRQRRLRSASGRQPSRAKKG